MNKTFKKIFSVCCAAVTTLTATLFHSTNLRAVDQIRQIVFVGPIENGKTNLISRICDNRYYSHYWPTRATNFHVAGQLTIWDTSIESAFNGVLPEYLTDDSLCVLSVSTGTEIPDDLLKSIAESKVPNVVLCITKTDESVPDSGAVRQLLGKVEHELPSVKVFDEVLYTSAKNNTFRFCKPDMYNDSNEYQIYNDEKKEMVLADKLCELCERIAKNFRDNIHRQPVSSGNSGYKANFQNGNSEPTYSFRIGQRSSTAKPPTSKAQKYAQKFGITAGLLTLIFGTAYYEYDRHFRKQEKTKTKTKSEQTSKVDRTISS